MKLEQLVGKTVVAAEGEDYGEHWGWGPTTLTFDDGSIARFRLDGDDMYVDVQDREDQRRAALAAQGEREAERLERLRNAVLRAEEDHMRSILSPAEFEAWMDENRMTVNRMNRLLKDAYTPAILKDMDDSPLLKMLEGTFKEPGRSTIAIRSKDQPETRDAS